ncbi:MAG: hypothetical protein IPL27_27390 [Lewinellaceae bacterium]|nr:hypothetical protein [Lewinellaceae bacterium]
MEIRFEKLKPGGATGHFFLLPNINRSDRLLKPTVTAEDMASVQLDFQTPSRKLSDPEIYSLKVFLSKEELAAHRTLSLEIACDPALFQVLNKSAVPYVNQAKISIDLKQESKDNTKTNGLQFYVEVISLLNSPLLANQSSANFRCFIRNELQTVLARFPESDKQQIRPSQLVLMGDDYAPERIFMCEKYDNRPSVEEMKTAVTKIGVDLTLVPVSVGQGDTWLQDQFQLGFCTDQEKKLPILLHLPRMTNDNTIDPLALNLKNFTDNYFPSKQVGVFNDFWINDIEVTDGSKSASLSVADTFIVYKRFQYVIRVFKRIVYLLIQADKNELKTFEKFKYSDLYSVRLQIRAALQRLKLKEKADTKKFAPLDQAVLFINTFLSIGENETVNLFVNVKDPKTQHIKNETFVFNVDKKEYLNNFFIHLNQVHSSLGYGGNIEVSPAMPSLPYGKIVTGSMINSDLQNFLTANPQQPACLVYTEWLKVGHIDELAGFVKKNGSSEFSVVRASPNLGLALLQALVAYKNKHETALTRLFRGKIWGHERIPNGLLFFQPPAAYARFVKTEKKGDDCVKGKYDLCGLQQKFPPDPQKTFYDSAYYDDRKFMVYNPQATVNTAYAAFISCDDLLEQVGKTNRAIEDLFLSKGKEYAENSVYKSFNENETYKKEIVPFRLDLVLDKEFKGHTLIRLPVLFDYTDEGFNDGTGAITPDLANFQTLGAHLLVPRPYGPRMKTDDAIAFIKSFVAENNINADLRNVAADITRQWIVDQGLNQTWHWLNPKNSISMALAGQEPSEFDENYEAFRIQKSIALFSPSYISKAAEDILPPLPDPFFLQIQKNPFTNHPSGKPENLSMMAQFFKDGFDAFKIARLTSAQAIRKALILNWMITTKRLSWWRKPSGKPIRVFLMKKEI